MIFDGRGAPAAPGARPQPQYWSADAITGSCLGHSTVLMNFLGVRVLTDPVFSTRVGLGFQPLVLGPKRHVRPALRPGEFDAPDVIILSHAHFDHLDVASLRQFSRDTPIVTARNTRDLLKCWRFRDLHELDWGEEHLRRWAEPGPNGRVFVGPKGATPRRSNFNRLWKEAAKKAGIDPEVGLRFHDLRHTGNHLTSRGASLRDVMNRMGHASTRAALIYQHADKDRERDIAAGLSQAITQALADANGHVAGTEAPDAPPAAPENDERRTL